LCAGDDQNLFELVEVGRRLELNEGVGLMVRIGFDRLDCADGKTARVDLIAT
jgi:hypothetical protein